MTSPPTIDAFAHALTKRGKSLFDMLRQEVLAFTGVTERMEYDEHAGEWVPTYTMGRRQLFHLHIHAAGRYIGATFPVPPSLAARLLDSHSAPLLKEHVAAAATSRRTQWVHIPLEDEGAIAAFLGAVRMKYDAVRPARRARKEPA